MVELRQLKYFCRVAELEHFGRAADDLHIVQPALSRQIRQLEEELDVELFERLPRGVRLTSAGRMLLERLRSPLSEIDRVLSVARLAGQGKTGLLKVGFSDGATYSGHVPRIVGNFRKRFPGVDIELLLATSLEQGDMLARGALDVGFVYWIPKGLHNISHFDLKREQIVLAVAKSNPLSTKTALRLAELQNSRFVWFERKRSPMFYDMIVSRCERAGLTLNVVQHGLTESIMLSLVSADVGVTFITESAKLRKPENVVLVPVKDLDAAITLKAIWRTDDGNPAMKSFLSVVKSSKTTD